MLQKAQSAKEAAAKVSVEKESVAKVEKEGSKEDLSAKTEGNTGENTENVGSTEATHYSEVEDDKSAVDKACIIAFYVKDGTSVKG